MVADRDGRPSRQGDLRVRNIIAGKSTTKEMVVERLTTNTNDTKSAESDLMAEVAKVITDQTKTLADAISDMDDKAQGQLNALRTIAKNSDARVMKTAMLSALKEVGLIGSNTGNPVKPTPSGATSADVGKLDKDLTDKLKDLADAIKGLANAEASGGGGGEAGGRTEGKRGPGETVQDVKNFSAAIEFQEYATMANHTLNRFQSRVEKMNIGLSKIVGEAFITEIESGAANLAGSVQRMTSSLVDLSKVSDFVRDRISTSMTAATSGVLDFGETFLDFAPGIVRGGDNLKSTLATVRSSLESGLISPLGTMGDDLYGVSEALYQTRSDFRDQGVNSMSRLGFEEANEAMIQLFSLERRRDVGASISSSMTTRNMARQLEYAQMIATNTGQTAAEVLKANQERAKEVANLQAGGILAGPDGENFNKAMMAFSGAGMSGFTDLVSGIARAGGDPTLYLAQNQDFAQGLATTGKVGEFYNLIDAIRSGADPNQIMQMAGRMGGGNMTGVAGSTTIGDQMLNLSGEAGMARNYRPDEEPGWVVSTTTWLKDAWANSGLQEIALAAAIGANVTALWANTAALLGGGMMGGLMGGIGKGLKGIGGGLLRGGKGLLSMGGKGLGLMATGAGAAGTMAMAGGKAAAGGLGKMGLKSLVKKIPIIGLLASLGFAGSRALAGDWTGAGLEIASGAAGTIPGLGTAASLGLDATLAARDMGAFGESGISPSSSSLGEVVGPADTNATTNAGIRNDTQRLITETNRILDRILVLAQDEVDVLKDIKGNTSRQTITETPGFWDKYFGDEPLPASGAAAPG